MRPLPTSTSRDSASASAGLYDDRDAMSCNGSMHGTACFMVTESELDSAEPSEIMMGRSMDKRNIDLNTQTPSPASSSPPRPGAGTPTDLSAPSTPVFAGLSRPESSLSCVSSPRNLSSSSSFINRDGSIANAVIKTGELQGLLQNTAAEGHVPQLIMPSVLVPRRRPFTDVGKSLGKLKIMVMGSIGIGKSSLIRSITQLCEHIVHIDSSNATQKGSICEMYASTRPYQWWRAESSFSATIKRRRSSTSTEEILDRNISFLDYTPSEEKTSSDSVERLESYLRPLFYKQMAEGDLVSLLSSGAEPIVDVVLYMLPASGPSASDIQLLLRLHTLTNIIPLLARADELDASSLEDYKYQLREDLDDKNIDIFSFPGLDQPECVDVFSASSATQRDDDVVDASVLMSSTYMEPLVHTDLNKLVDCMFSLDGASQLRHAAALKAIAWLRKNRHCASSSALVRRSYNTDVSMVTNPFCQMRDWRRLEISGWAQSLRQSLDYERIINATGSAQMHTELSPRQPQAVAKRHTSPTNCRKKRRHVQQFNQDPLGLIELVGHLKNSGTLAVELLSGIGVVGYLAMCIMKPESADRNIGALSRWCLAIA